MKTNNHKGEEIKEYIAIEDAIYDLKDFVKNDYIYQEFLNDKNYKLTAPDIVAINHIKAIIKVLNEYKDMKERSFKHKNDTM